MWAKEKKGRKEGIKRFQRVIEKSRGALSGMDVRYTDIFFCQTYFSQTVGGYLRMEESNNLHLFPLVPRLMKNAFTTCFALTGFSGRFWSLATCHLDWSWWKYDVQVMAFSASSICCCVIEVSLTKRTWAINKAHGGLTASTHSTEKYRTSSPLYK